MIQNIVIALVLYLNLPLQIASHLAQQRLVLENSQHKLVMPISSNIDTLNHNTISQIIVVVHGIIENSDEAYQSLAKITDKNTLIVAPQFLTKGDASNFNLPNNIPYWKIKEWVAGKKSLNSNISSYVVMDKILKKLSMIAPNVKTTVIGFSAGGQFVQRYAMLGNFPNTTNFIVISPSSYLYTTKERYNDQLHQFKPIQNTRCKYNNYIYGIEKMPPYLENNLTTKIARYGQLNIQYLVGGKDLNRSFMLDKSCGADFEGKTRVERLVHYIHYLNTIYPNKNFTQNYYIVKDVAHNQDKMLSSTQLAKILPKITTP